MDDHREIPSAPGYRATPGGEILGKRWGCPLAQFWRGSSRSKYLCVNIHTQGKQASRSVHSLILEAFNGPRPDGMVGRHLNGDRADNSAENLAWGTPEENLEDARRHGTVGRVELGECRNGHQYTPENKMPNGDDGGYRCRTCHNDRERARYRLKRNAA